MLKPKKEIKTLLTLLLVPAMSLSLYRMPVFAAEEEIDKPVVVEADNAGVNVTVGDEAATTGQAVVDTASEPAEVTIMEDIHTGDDAVCALTVTADSNVPVSVSVGKVDAGMGGIMESADNYGSVTVTAESVSSGDPSVIIDAGDTGNVEATVGSSGADGAGTAEEPVIRSERGNGIEARSNGGSAAATIDGNMEAGHHGILVENTDGTANITVNGDLTAGTAEGEADDDNCAAICVTTEGTGITEITVNGDAGSEDTGIAVNGAGTNDVTVTGTLSVEEGGAPILIGSTVTGDNLEITVWKIETGGKQAQKGGIVRIADDGGNPMPMAGVSEEDKRRAQNVEKRINYIIRIDPQQNGSNLSSDRDTAHAGETVKVTVTIPEGQALKAVYTDEGKSLTAKDNGDGTYILEVPVGGGVYVHAEFEELPAQKPEPEPEQPLPRNEDGTGKDAPAARAASETSSESGAAEVSTVPAAPYFLSVVVGTARFVLVNDEQRVTLTADNLRTLVSSAGVSEFVFVMNGKT
ncbi:MAG: hypothetical protein K5770_04425 [Lachnospiraceae bacterium]|nr:hypothetical protein [Lachnospiraceae bacterium]